MNRYKIRVRRGDIDHGGRWYAAPGKGTVRTEEQAHAWTLFEIQERHSVLCKLRSRKLTLKLVLV